MSRSQPASGPTISLFPFLAVLLCTMGALLVVLVLFSRAVKEGVVAEADGGRAELEQELEQARDSLSWRVQQLEGVRERTAEDLARARMQLAGVEENTRALEDEMARLERMAAALDSGKALAADEAALKELENRLASARESLDKARADQRTKPPAYAVVPYAGRNGTHRRPLYIECAGDGVFLQPENIRLGPADFQGPPGPGNPLASALRAAREHILVGQGGTTDPAMQPYPLLIVRPSGVMAYYAAREAIQSWGSDFGYQLVDEDWTLAFPPADPALAQVERRAVEESRQRLAWLSEVRPSRPAKQPRQYRAAQTRGGVVADEGPSVLGDQSRWDWANGGADAAGGAVPAARRGGGDGFGDARGAGGGGLGAGGQPGGTGDGFRQSVFSAGTSGGTRGASFGGGSGAGGFGGGSGPSDADGPGGNGRAATGGTGPTGGAGASADGTASASGGSGGDGRGGRMGSPTGAPGSSDADGLAASSAAGGLGGGSASGAATAGGAGGSSGAASGSASGGAGGGGSGPAMPGLAKAGGGGQPGSPPAGSSASVSMAQSRGKNWASLATQDRPIPLTRPIRLECAADEFRLMDDSGRRVQVRIPIDGDTALAIDPLVKAVHARVETWGLAGDRMYWKPVLVLSESSDGRSRREDLERLLVDSGLDARSADGRDLIRPLPPVERTTAAAR